MLVLDSDWEKIREHFGEEEKNALRRAIVGQSICPKGWQIDTTSTGVPILGDKIRWLLKEK